MLSVEVENRIKVFNPWILDPEKAADLINRFLPREYVVRTAQRMPLQKNRALLIVGPRQAGKSTMVWRLLKNLAPDILYLNMEDPLLRIGCGSSMEFAAYVRENFARLSALFLDEIQHMDEAGLFVKGLVDAHLDIPIIVTGSSSFDLRSRTRESLAGRATRCLLAPFSAREMLRHAAPKNPVSQRHFFEMIFSHQVVFGSYPSVYLAPDPEAKARILSDLVEALILRDASDLFQIKRVDAFRALLALAAGQIGNLVNYSEWASLCSVDVGTVKAYMEILEEGHVVKRLQPFAGGRRREIIGAPKAYFVDNGIRNQLLNSFSRQLPLRTDKGELFENWAFSEAYKRLPLQSSLKFWRSKSKAEVDFVIEHAGTLCGLEVKFSSLKTPKVSRSSWSFMDAYEPDRFAVLNLTLQKDTELKGRRIQFLTPLDLPEWLENVFQLRA